MTLKKILDKGFGIWYKHESSACSITQNLFQTEIGDFPMLKEFKVLDLTTEAGWLCGKMLGDLGADVIKIEPPGGDPGRHRGPFYKKTPDPEKSLFWFALNANKRGITLNIESGEGRDILKKLVEETDCVVESFPARYPERARA